MSEGSTPDAEVTGRFYDEMQDTGWGRLYVQSPSVTQLTGFAAGYLEGALTAHRIVAHLANYKAMNHLDTLPSGVQSFIEVSDAWIRAQIAGADAQDLYWSTVRFQYDQLDGMLQGANAYLQSHERMSRLDVLLLALSGDMSDIKSAVNETKAVNFDNMTVSEVMLWQQLRGHCSALIKLVPDGSELFVGHNTWIDYSSMSRIFKRYEFGGMPAIAMSSFPGILASWDDFYQMDDLVVLETTTSNYNHELFTSVVPQALPYWIRAMAANYMAKSGPQWMEIFKQYNSGTYNNMWMVVDYAKFTPGQPVPDGLLTVGEQLPGYFHYEDQTRVLTYGYWPSFNIAVYPETARLVNQDKIVQSKGISFSYQDNPRAQVFRRDQGMIQSDADMQRALRYNKFESDPLAHGNPCWQVACRGDLVAFTNGTRKPRNSVQLKGFGAIDAKYTSYSHSRAKRTVVISGPTHDDQPVFDWADADPDVQKTPHEGQPNRFDFGWYIMTPQIEAAPLPWPTDSDADSKARRLSLMRACSILIPLFVGMLVVQIVLRKCRRQELLEEDVAPYMRMKWQSSPATCSTSASNLTSPTMHSPSTGCLLHSP